jgi:hypothetical protein
MGIKSKRRRTSPDRATTVHYSNSFSGATVMRYTISDDPSNISKT